MIYIFKSRLLWFIYIYIYIYLGQSLDRRIYLKARKKDVSLVSNLQNNLEVKSINEMDPFHSLCTCFAILPCGYQSLKEPISHIFFCFLKKHSLFKSRGAHTSVSSLYIDFGIEESTVNISHTYVLTIYGFSDSRECAVNISHTCVFIIYELWDSSSSFL